MKNKIIMNLLATLAITGCGTPTNFHPTPSQMNNIHPQQLRTQGLAPRGWGKLSQIAGTYVDFQDVKGNQDGIWENEKDTPGTINGFGVTAPLRPWIEKKDKFVKGLKAKAYIKELKSFRAQQEQKWGTSVTRLSSNDIKDFELFAAQKTLQLTRLNRTPFDVIEGFVKAKGSVNGHAIKTRKIFWQRFKPINNPNGIVTLISPGFQETGRNFHEQVQSLNQQGYDVITMDHQWAGYSDGSPGGLDRGFGVARDVAAMAAFAQQVANQAYGQNSELILFGNSMGGGPGVLGAMTLNAKRLIKLQGPAMPRNLKAVLQAPYLDSSSGLINSILGLFSKLPFANTLQLFSSGLPILTYDKSAAQKGTQVVIMEDIRAQLRTMSSANRDLKYILKLIKDGHGPRGKINIVHGNRDPLANPSKSRWLEKQLGEQVNLNLINSKNHVLEQHPQEQHYAIEAINQFRQMK